MINATNILKSSKREGKYEAVIINRLVPYFENLGYAVVPHARFNISWGNIISDVDLLLLKENEMTLVEVKSSRDNLQRAKNQIKNIQDFVDYVYIATDYHPRKWGFRNAGLIVVNGSIEVVKKAKKIDKKPRYESVCALQKKCLLRMSKKDSKNVNIKKCDLASVLMSGKEGYTLRQEMKEIVTCGLKCETSCPIWDFKETLNDNLITLCQY